MSTPKVVGGVKRGRKPKNVLPSTALGSKIRKARLDQDLTTTQLGARIGVSNVTLTYIETGQTNPAKRTLILLAQELRNDFGEKWLRPYAQKPGFSISFGEKEREIIQKLAKDEGRSFEDQAYELVLEALMNRRLITDRVDTNVVFLGDRVPRMVSMEVLGEIAAGQPIEAIPQKDRVEIPETFIKPGREQFVLRARGDSMIDEGIHDGSLLVCDVAQTAKNGDMVVALIDGEQATVKKFYREKTRIRLQPANKLLSPIYVDPKKLQIQGIVVGIIRHRP